jgi:signal transduction histidine kinase
MSANWLLNTAVLAFSLFNTMLLLWLGLVVVSNADRRSWGIWLASGGLLCGGIFFLIHTAIVGRGLSEATADLDLLWHLGWFPIIIAPLAWYVVMLWYAGFLGSDLNKPAVRQIHLPGLSVTVICALGLLLSLLLGALPTFAEIVTFGSGTDTPTPGTAWLVLLYAFYNLACIGLAIHALSHPEPSARWMGDLARQRAHPWLVAASAVLLIVSLLVSSFVLLVYFAYGPSLVSRQGTIRELLAWFDAVIGALIAAAVVLLGKATVSYEIFTGKTLPRSGFFRQWRRAVILAAGYSLLAAATLALPLSALYALLSATLLLVIFYALLSARLFGERERVVAELRPLLAPPARPGDGLISSVGRAPLDLLCQDVLNSRVAYLCPQVPFTLPLAHPVEAAPPLGAAAALVPRFTSPTLPYLAIPPEQFHGATWAIPLWSERGLLGIFLLGERKDGGLYTQEEFEIARATCERLVEAQAGAELTRRLIELQRGRLAATRVVDRQARRTLHDDILPQLHAAMLDLSAGQSGATLAALQQLHRALAELLSEIPAGAPPQLEQEGVLGALERTLDAEFGRAFDTVTWEITPEARAQALWLSALNAEVLYAAAREAVRNAARHGRGDDPTRPLQLVVRSEWLPGLVIEIQDDGIGFGHSGNGTGQGLELHSTLMAVVGGTLSTDRKGGKTFVRLFTPAG